MSIIKHTTERNTFILKYVLTYLHTTLTAEARLAERKLLLIRAEIEYRQIS
jgi:hypothetical protein